MNRRDWMITAITAIGFPSTEAWPASSALPPGLYLPSTDHLGHALMNHGQVQPGPPQFFSPREFAVIRGMAELILGEEPNAPNAGIGNAIAAWIDLRVFSSAGARAAANSLDPLHRTLAVAYYGAAAVHELESSDPRKICREGLAWVAERGDFISLDPHQQITILDSISDARPDKQSENAGTQFFAYVKSEIIKGFYTSRTGLKELDYKGNAFYASSPGCKQAPK
ncbi:MAG TPA: gluconate 2-dehydrogenase subunit 3 family protein [Bryobacteraceae bacterium]|nr:gluconate 2-dehydrogenase subunit 3 family protein [Bryobacteraceae bacterium]